MNTRNVLLALLATLALAAPLSIAGAGGLTVCLVGASFEEGNPDVTRGLEQYLAELLPPGEMYFRSTASAGATCFDTWRTNAYGEPELIPGMMTQVRDVLSHPKFVCDYLIVGLNGSAWFQATRDELIELPGRIQWELGSRLDGHAPKAVLYTRYPELYGGNDTTCSLMEPGYRQLALQYEQAAINSGGHVVPAWEDWQASSEEDYHPNPKSVERAARKVAHVIQTMEACENNPALCPPAIETAQWGNTLPANFESCSP